MLTFLLFGFMGATVCVLLAGLFFMLRGGEGDEKRSNRMMMMRVGFQAAAVALLGLMFLVSR